LERSIRPSIYGRCSRFRGIRALGGAPAVFVVAGWPIEDPDATEIVPGFWDQDG
jgi:hypothetical protein